MKTNVLSCAALACATLLSAPPSLAADILFEFYNTTLNHYFLTIDPDEAAAIDSGAAGPGWQRTNKNIGAYRSGDDAPAGAQEVCRFYGNQANGGPNGHFYTAEPAECEAVKLDPGWTFERNEFFVTVPFEGACPGDDVPVFRNYNGRFAQHDSNHRYSTDPTVYAQMSASSWTPEGVVFCGAAIGANWTRQASNTADTLLGVAFPTMTTGYIAGINGRILKTVDAGATWTPMTTGTTQFIRDIHFTSATTGTAVGESGLIRRTTDGQTWTPQASGTTEHLVHVHFANANLGMTSGQGGVLRKTVDGGATWTPMTSGTTVELPGVFVVDANVAYAVGFGGKILKTANGGATWVPQQSGVTANLRSVWFYNADIGYAVGLGGTILRTFDGGENWLVVEGVTSTDLYAVAFADPENGIAVGTTRIFRTADAGETWTNESPAFAGDLYGIAIKGIGSSYAVGQNGNIFRR